jgi:hypothetical protein
MAGGGLTKSLGKGFGSFHKYSGAMRLQQATIGKKNFEKLHFISTGAINAADKLKAAEKAAKGAEASAEALRRRQMEDMAKLDDEENNRIKKLLVAGRNGVRGYRAGPMFRARPTNAAGARNAAGAGSAAPGAAAMRAGGMNSGNGGSGFGYRGVQP